MNFRKGTGSSCLEREKPNPPPWLTCSLRLSPTSSLTHPRLAVHQGLVRGLEHRVDDAPPQSVFALFQTPLGFAVEMSIGVGHLTATRCKHITNKNVPACTKNLEVKYCRIDKVPFVHGA
mmetsp:Transcript_24569/g.68379  ORF Transcript_24569/g.68379 Transcript_24569/m.68379 type:complete len:120 (-) Transcript_24569:1390-1749(-)